MNINRSSKKSFNANKLRVGIVVSDYNRALTSKLLTSAISECRAHRVPVSHITVTHVVGSFEIAFALQLLARNKRFDCLVALGCIVKGETIHDEVLAHAVTQAIMRISLDYHIPIGLGVLTVKTLTQARSRAFRGADAVRAALAQARQ